MKRFLTVLSILFISTAGFAETYMGDEVLFSASFVDILSHKDQESKTDLVKLNITKIISGSPDFSVGDMVMFEIEKDHIILQEDWIFHSSYPYNFKFLNKDDPTLFMEFDGQWISSYHNGFYEETKE